MAFRCFSPVLSFCIILYRYLEEKSTKSQHSFMLSADNFCFSVLPAYTFSMTASNAAGSSERLKTACPSPSAV